MIRNPRVRELGREKSGPPARRLEKLIVAALAFVALAAPAGAQSYHVLTVHSFASGATGDTGATTLDIPFTMPANGNGPGTYECKHPALVVGISTLRNAGNAQQVSSVVWDPDPPGGSTYSLEFQTTQISVSADSGRKRVEMFLKTTLLPNPLDPIPSGAGNIVITSPVVQEIAAGVVLACGVDQEDPTTGATSGRSGATETTGTTITLTTVVDGLTVDILAVEGNVGVSSASPARTNRWNLVSGSTANDVRGYGSTYAPTGGSTNLAYTLDIADHWVVSAVGLRPAALTSVGVSDFAVRRGERGAQVSWFAGYDAGNLGYRLWRQRGGVRSLVTPELVAGSFLSHGATPLAAGHPYAWEDPEGRPGDVYELEAVALSGASGVVARGRLDGREVRRAARTASPTLGALAAATSPVRVRPYLPGSPAAGGPESQATQFWLAGQPAVKIGVRQSGWYRLPLAEVAAAGLPLEAAALGRLRLFADGREVALRVTLGPSGRLEDPGSALEFWGEGLDSPFADTRVYWLILDSRLGKRIARPSASSAAGGELGVFSGRVEVRERLVYVPAVRNGERENFFGRVLSAGKPVTYPLATPHLAEEAATRGALEVAIQGLTEGRHRVLVELNGGTVGVLEGEGQGPITGSFVLAPSQLRATAENQLVLTNQSGEKVVSIVDTVALTYPRRSRATANELLMPTVSWPTGGLLLGGFDEPGVRVFDVTDPATPVELAVREVRDGTAFGVAVVPAGGGRLQTRTALYAVAPSQLRRPAFVQANRPSQLHAAGNVADLLIVAPAGLHGALAPLVELRSTQGLRTLLVDLEDVFDEFSFGSLNPWALRHLAERAATQWQGKPAYLLLAGDGSYDPRNYLGAGGNLLPAALVDTTLFETASDDWFADFDGDGVPELAVGRLPATTAAELTVMVDKILRYEGGQRSPLRALLVADDPLAEAFSLVNQVLLEQLPAGTLAEHIDVEREGATAARARVLAELGRGYDLVHYSGHGTVDRWRHGLLKAEDAPTLPVPPRPAVLTMANCLSGIFQEPLLPGLAEQLLRAAGGPAAAWASTGSTRAPAQKQLLAAFLAAGYDQPGRRVGDAVRAAKAAVSETDVRLTWVLLGDPAMRLR